ncbi:MAG: hypothetical protein ACTSUL_08620 [Promethearchaeota archaeon]
MKKNKTLYIFSLVLFLLVGSIGISLIIGINFESTNNITNINFNRPITPQVDPDNVKIAIYDESNVSHPSYFSGGVLTNNFTEVENTLINAGFQVSRLTTQQIYNHGLNTSDFDILIMVDNIPREKIVNYVKEFWLGGGSILSFDSGISFLCYAGILPPESEGNDGYNVYWKYVYSKTQNITLKNPITKSHDVGDTFNVYYADWATYNWTTLQSSSIASDFYKIATNLNYPNNASIVALEPSIRGGKTIQILTSYYFKENTLLIDAIIWLAPKPKARIVYDLSHHPRLSVDPWDDLTQFPGYYETIRDDLVSRDYLFDKLYPMAIGNFTLKRLQKYNLLIIVSPDYNYSDSDIQVINDWMDSGGSLLILGESGSLSSFKNPVKQLNKLLSNFSLQINLTTLKIDTISANKWKNHQTFEFCTHIKMQTRGGINISGSAYPLWKYDGDILIAAQEYKDSKIILSADMNWMTDSQITNDDNEQFAINIVNWLTSYKTETLIVPGYNTFLILFSLISFIGVLSLFLVKKKLRLIVRKI